jgi:cytosine/adenosine deaminase-related metal-dependent hydrolase
VFEALHEKYRSEERVAIQLAPANLHWCSDHAITRTVDLARQYRVPLHMHILETPLQKEYARRRTGTTAVHHLETLGALGPNMTLGHGVWVTEEDIGSNCEERYVHLPQLQFQSATEERRRRTQCVPCQRRARGARLG